MSKTISLKEFLNSKEVFECFVLNAVSQSRQPRMQAMRDVLMRINNATYSESSPPNRESSMAIATAFDWSSTPEKDVFWRKISVGWSSYLANHFPDALDIKTSARGFLERNGVLQQFLTNCKLQEQEDSYLEKNENDPRCISTAFTWALTPEKHMFWAKLHDQFFMMLSDLDSFNPGKCSVKEDKPVFSKPGQIPSTPEPF